MKPLVTLGIHELRQLNMGPVLPPLLLGTWGLARDLCQNCRDDTLKIWIDGAAKDNHIAGVGVVYNDPSIPYLYGPVESNMTAKATNNKADLQAAVLGLEEAKEHNFKKVELNTDSKLLKHVMTKWIDEWKERNWKKLDGSTLKLPIDLLKKLDMLRSEMRITWKWLPRNSCPEMVLADALANLGCKTVVDLMAKESAANEVFRRTVYDRRMMFPDELPPTVLRTKEQIIIPPGVTVRISCTLDISERLKQKLIQNRTSIMNMSADQAYGFVTTLRTSDPLDPTDGTVIAKCHTQYSAFEVESEVNKELIEPTLVLPFGSVVGLAFSGPYGKLDDQVDPSFTDQIFFTPRDFRLKSK